MEPPGIISTILIFICLVAIAVLSSAESSIIAVNKFKLRHLIDTGNKRALALQRILNQHDKLFSAVILSGNLFAQDATLPMIIPTLGAFTVLTSILRRCFDLDLTVPAQFFNKAWKSRWLSFFFLAILCFPR